MMRLCRFPRLLTAMLSPRLAAVWDALEAFGVEGVSDMPPGLAFERVEVSTVALSSVMDSTPLSS